MVGKHRGDDFLQGKSLCLPSGWTVHVSWSENKSWELSSLFISQEAVCIVHFIAVASPSSPIHSLFASTQAPSLSLAHLHLMHLMHTYLTHRPIPERGWQLLMQETHQQNLNPLLFHLSRRCGSIWDFQWVMLTTFALSTKSQFARSAETRWQVILFKFPTDWIFKLLLHYVLNKSF